MFRTPLAAALLTAGVALAPSAPAAQTPPKPDVTPLLTGFDALWHPSSTPLHGDVRDGGVLAHSDEMVSWVNQHATAAQRTRALRDAMYRTSSGEHYDQSLTSADGLGRTLGDLYLEGRRSGKLPLTSALLDSSDGSAGDFVSTSKAKSHYSYPRPFLRARADDHGACRADHADASSLAANRSGRAWADGDGDLTITRVAPQRDSSRRYVAKDVTLDPNYDGLCLSGSFPSGHTVTAYEAGTTLATLVPEVAPGVLARASEAANNRLVLGVHYPLDVIGGRMAAQSGIATLWADESFRTSTLEPARKELRDYLSAGCTKKFGVATLAECVAKDQPYRDDPYGGSVTPGGSSQQVSDRASALAVYRERLDYGSTPKSAAGQGDSAPDSAGLVAFFPGICDGIVDRRGFECGHVAWGVDVRRYSWGVGPPDDSRRAARRCCAVAHDVSDAHRRSTARGARADGDPGRQSVGGRRRRSVAAPRPRGGDEPARHRRHRRGGHRRSRRSRRGDRPGRPAANGWKLAGLDGVGLGAFDVTLARSRARRRSGYGRGGRRWCAPRATPPKLTRNIPGEHTMADDSRVGAQLPAYL